jgi:hypothetical protein
MIIINLTGGLGNQLFQYALGRKLAITNNDVLKIDLQGLKPRKIKSVRRSFSLGEFNIKAELASPAEIDSLKYPYKIISRLTFWLKYRILKQSNLKFNPKILKIKPKVYLHGLWQSPLYFSDIRQYLLSELIPTNVTRVEASPTYNFIEETNSVSIHIRRGDYVSDKNAKYLLGLCSLTYYIESIERIKRVVKNPVFFIFSDDIPWVMKNLPVLGEYHYINDRTMNDVDQFWLMSRSKHHIISNSTYSWWAAWLNVNDKKIIVCPDPWYDNIICDPSLIAPEWIRLSK